jgi:hypothetical protein
MKKGLRNNRCSPIIYLFLDTFLLLFLSYRFHIKKANKEETKVIEKRNYDIHLI